MKSKWGFGALALAGLMASSLQARAAFTQATCATSGWGTAVPTEIGALEYIKQSTSPAGGATDMTLYNHATSQSWQLHVNDNVSLLNGSFGYFVTETNYDYLKVTASGGVQYTYTGVKNNTMGSLLPIADTWSSTSGYVTFAWFADGSVAPYMPPSIGELRPRCKASQSGTIFSSRAIASNTRTDGILLQSGDTIYFNVPQTANQPMLIRLDALLGGFDSDLYVSTTTSTPDDASFQWRGYTGSGSEALLIPAASSWRTLYIGVHSYSGAGHFALSADYTNPQSSRVCTADASGHKVTYSAGTLATVRAFLQGGSAYLYGFTNGMVFRNQYTLQNLWGGTCDADPGCDVCLYDDGGGVSNADFPASSGTCAKVYMHGGAWANNWEWLFAHESVHACYGLADEYQGPPNGEFTPRYCGHTNMANSPKALGLCSYNHCYDGQVNDYATCSNLNGAGNLGKSNWTQMLTKGWYYSGPNFASTTAYPTPSWNNPSLRALVTTTGF